MKFKTPLDELQHWLGMLRVDVALGVDRRHLKATARLCALLIDQLDAADPASLATLDSGQFQRLEVELRGLQCAIEGQLTPANAPAPARRAIKTRRVRWRPRVIEGGK